MNEDFRCHGHFRMVDEQGNILIDNNNMIVETGRLRILEKLMDNTSSEGLFSNMKLFLSDSTKMTTPGRDRTSIGTIYRETSLSNENGSNATYRLDKGNLNVTIKSTFIADTGKTIGSAGLYKPVGENASDGKLFSRLTFPPVTLKEGATYTINYIIQF